MMGSPLFTALTFGWWVSLAVPSLNGFAATVQPASQTEATTKTQTPDPANQTVTRKAGVQARLDALGSVGTGQDPQAELRTVLEQTLSLLTALENQTAKRDHYQTQLAELPQRLREVEAKHQELLRTPGRRFPPVDEQMRSEYQAQLQAALDEIQGIIKATVDGEVRLANIPRELTDQAQQQAQYQQDLLFAQNTPAETTLQQARLQLLELQVELSQREGEVLTSEREWLLKRVPLQDALLRFSQARHQRLQQELNTITAALGQALAAEQATLSATAADITQKMQQTLNPVEALQLRVGLETVEVRRQTADARGRLNELSELVITQERKAAHTKQLSDRLKALIEKYAAGEVAGQRVLVLFDRLQRERAQSGALVETPFAQELRALNEQLFTLEDTLYEFDYVTEQRLAQLKIPEAESAVAYAETARRTLRPLFDEQKNALRDQQQVLVALTQEQTKLLTLDQEYKRQLDESQVFALTALFWVRNNAPLGLDVVRQAIASVTLSARQVVLFVQAEWQRGQALLHNGIGVGVLGLVVFIIVPWVALRSYRRFRLWTTFLPTNAHPNPLPGWAAALLIIIQSSIWPLYVLFLSWLYDLLHDNGQGQESPPFVLGLRMVALLLWLGLFGHALFRREGWARQYWRLSPEVCRSFAWTVAIVIGAAMVCLVPRFLLTLTPGSGETMGNSQALARLLFLLFQVVVVVLIGVMGRRRGPLAEILRSREEDEKGLLWSLWPIVYSVVMTALIVLIGLDILGYSYASQFLWSRIFLSLAIIFFVRLLFIYGLPWAVRVGARLVVRGLRQNLTLEKQRQEASRYLGPTFSLLGGGLIILAAAVTLLEVWGLPIRWVLASPTLWQAMTRAGVIAITIGVTMAVVRTSRFITNSVLSPPPGEEREVGRKLKTLAPLVQTVIRVGAIFAATLVVLEQLGIATGPVLAGAGIFGLAVGFASQSLIKDVINGLFILFEDSLSVGDVVQVHGTGGQVEKFTLRAVTLRDVSGNVHVIPNSVIDTVTNMTKDYSRYVLDVGIAYHENVSTVIAILREIDEGMRRDPDYGRDMLEPIEILGLERFEESAVIIRARLKTRPIQQWRIGREFNRRLKQVFDERGIEIPFPQRTLHWVGPADGGPQAVVVSEKKDCSSFLEEVGDKK